MRLPDVSDVLAAREALAGVLPRTPVLRSEALDDLAGSRLWFKAEGLQVTGSFKVRGAWNRIRSFTPEELAPGLITVSAGNAALGAAWAARTAGARLVVVMPENAVPEKLQAVAAMGARIEKEGVTNATQAFERLARLRSEHGYTLVHPFDDPFVIAGAATATWELLKEVPGPRSRRGPHLRRRAVRRSDPRGPGVARPWHPAGWRRRPDPLAGRWGADPAGAGPDRGRRFDRPEAGSPQLRDHPKTWGGRAGRDGRGNP